MGHSDEEEQISLVLRLVIARIHEKEYIVDSLTKLIDRLTRRNLAHRATRYRSLLVSKQAESNHIIKSLLEILKHTHGIRGRTIGAISSRRMVRTRSPLGVYSRGHTYPVDMLADAFYIYNYDNGVSSLCGVTNSRFRVEEYPITQFAARFLPYVINNLDDLRVTKIAHWTIGMVPNMIMIWNCDSHRHYTAVLPADSIAISLSLGPPLKLSISRCDLFYEDQYVFEVLIIKE